MRKPRVVVERASSADRALLAMDTGAVPEQFGVVLLLDRAADLDLSRVRELMAERVLAVPRLRQRLVRAPLAGGGPIWVDDPGFDIARHVRSVPCRSPGDQPALLDTALSVILDRLPRSAPQWSVVLVTDLADGAAGVVVVLHHVLADGVGGLAVLATLIDPGAAAADTRFPRPRPARQVLVRDAWLARVRAARQVTRSWRSLRHAMSAGGGVRPPRAVPCSLVRRTGTRRALAMVSVDRPRLRAAAHRRGASTNDAVLVAVAGALHHVLLARGESVDPITITVPVSGRGQQDGQALGNLVSPLLVHVPTSGDADQRLAHVSAAVRAGKSSLTGPPPIAILGWLFRLAARLGGFRFYLNHQRRFHTLVSHVRGPDRAVTFADHRITTAIPVSVGEAGNVTTHFAVLSYADLLTITVTVDPDHVPDLGELTQHLRLEVERIMTAS